MTTDTTADGGEGRAIEQRVCHAISFTRLSDKPVTRVYPYHDPIFCDCPAHPRCHSHYSSEPMPTETEGRR